MAAALGAEDNDPTTTSTAAHESQLLALPPEIRNMIYSHVCVSLDRVRKAQFAVFYDTRDGKLSARPRLGISSHPLTGTCRQLRSEFKPVLATVEPSQAHHLEWKLLDFHFQAWGGELHGLGSKVTRDEIYSFLCRLPPLENGAVRTMTKKIDLRNLFDLERYLKHIRFHHSLDEDYKEIREGKIVKIRTEFRLVSPSSFDIRGCEANMQALEDMEHYLMWLRKPLQEVIDGEKQKLATWRRALCEEVRRSVEAAVEVSAARREALRYKWFSGPFFECAGKVSGMVPTAPYLTQESPLLSLPPEVRNMIYEYACCSIDKALIKINYRSTGGGEPQPLPHLAAISHALEASCRQVRAEFRPILAAADRRNARALVWHVKNFLIGGLLEGSGVKSFLNRLPLLPDGSKRTLFKAILLDSNFAWADRGTQACGPTIHCCLDEEYEPSRRSLYKRTVTICTSIHFDIPTFTSRELEHALQKWDDMSRSFVCGEYGHLRMLRLPIERAMQKYKKMLEELEQAKADASRARRGRREQRGDDVV